MYFLRYFFAKKAGLSQQKCNQALFGLPVLPIAEGVEETETGNPITITDAIQKPARELSVDFEPKQNGTPWKASDAEKAPYLFRAMPQIGHSYNREYMKVVGGTVAWNQSAPANKKSGTIRPMGNYTYAYSSVYELNANQVYLTHFKIKYNGTTPLSSVYYQIIANPSTFARPIFNMADVINDLNNGKTVDVWFMCRVTSYQGSTLIGISTGTGGAILQTTDTANWDNLEKFNLTTMFGTSVADRIINLEASQQGSGFSLIKDFFTKDFNDYTYPPVLMSVKTSALKTIGFNAFDVTTGKAKLIGGNQYQITGAYTALSYSSGETITPDSSGKFTPSASGELTVTGGDATTCVHFVYDGERDGEYEAYVEHTYALDSDLELRGIPKIDSNNNLYYDGDVYEADGTVTRNYGYRAYESGDELLTDTITDGTNTVYKLTTSTTETADAFQSPQIVNNWGTEEFVDERTVPVPVGHDSLYADEYSIIGHTGVSVIHGASSDDPNPTTYTVLFTSQGIVYGGTVDIVSGVLTVIWGYIASYNGETLTGEWMSSKDVYVSGTTPSLGAEVAYELASPITYQLTAQQVDMLLNNNYFSTAEENMTIKYLAASH